MVGKTTEYAIRALVYIYLRNMAGERPGFREIAEKISAPSEFTGKVVQTLAKSGIIQSMKGPGGGFSFADMDAPVTLMQVINYFEGVEFFHKCVFGLSGCTKSSPCPLHNEYAPVREKLSRIASESTIQLLASRIKKNKAFLIRNPD